MQSGDRARDIILQMTKKKRMALSGSQVWRNTRLELRDIPVPNINDDEILIKVKVCGICKPETNVYEIKWTGVFIQGYVILTLINGGATEFLMCAAGTD
jgi:D-arabinose 1-dehydrogenase-like Zn-dependent alcohol dehydrogenase